MSSTRKGSRTPVPRVRPLHSRRLAVAVCALALSPLSTGLVAGQDLDLGGQIRPRFETRDPPGGGIGTFTSMRTRLHVAARLDRGVEFFAQLQDVRFWGEEAGPLSDFAADQLDLHQGFVRLPLFDEAGELVVGRQEVSLGEERLVGAVDWTQQGQSFDGVRFMLRPGRRGRVDLLAFQIEEDAAPGRPADAGLIGSYLTFPGRGLLRTLEGFAFFDGTDGAEEDTGQWTLGGRMIGAMGPLSVRAEAAVQRGERSDEDVEAFMIGARAGTRFAEERAELTLWYDYLSGDDDPGDGTTEVFSTLFATNHKFYGFADIFLDIPAHTGGRGLQDFAVKGWLDVNEDLAFGLDAHHFRAAESSGLSSSRFADELDVTGRWRFGRGVALTGGVSVVAPDDALAEVGRLAEDLVFAYLMLDVKF